MSQMLLPPGWKSVNFADTVKFTKKPKGFTYRDYDQVPFVPMEFLPTSGLFFEQFIFKKPAEITSGTYFETGDILVAKITPSFENGKQGIIEKLPTPFGFATTEVIPFREIEDKSDKLFLYYYLLRQSVRADLASKMEGTTGRQRLSKSAIENLDILLPTLPEQRAIARTVRAVQAAREARLRELALERERKAALMEHLFRHGTEGEVTKQTEIGEMPESWETIQLEMACLKIVDCPHSTPHFSPTGVLVARNFNIKDGQLDLKSSFYTTEKEYLERIKRCEPVEGDILFSREAPVGEACLVPSNTKLCLGQRMMLLRVDASKLNGFFLVQALYSNAIRSIMMAISSGVTAKHLNVADVKRLRIPLPQIEEQKQIANILSACDSKIAALDHEARLLDELFRAMLEELMSGRLSTAGMVKNES